MYYKNADARKINIYRLSIHAIVALDAIPACFDSDAMCFKIFLQTKERLSIDQARKILGNDNKPVFGTNIFSVDGSTLWSGYASLKGLAELSQDERINSIHFFKPALLPTPNMKGPEFL